MRSIAARGKHFASAASTRCVPTPLNERSAEPQAGQRAGVGRNLLYEGDWKALQHIFEPE